MISRRALMEAAMAAAALSAGVSGFGRGGRALAAGGLTQDDLLSFDAKGQVTLLHLTDIHAQLVPIYFREPSVNIGVGEVRGKPPHITGKAFLERFGIDPGGPLAYALTPMDFEALARDYGKMGGLDRIATLVKAVRAERGEDRVLFLDGGDTWQGSYTALKTDAADMVECMAALKPDAMTGHWEFTYGEDRVLEIAEEIDTPFLAGNIVDTEWEEPVFESTRMFEKGGVQVAVIGQAFPYTPIANPRWMIPNWSFGIRPDTVQEHVDAARAAGAEVVVLLSHDGFDVDRKLAGVVDGIDVILTGHTHDAVPEAVRVGETLLISSGSHGKFLSRLDLEVKDGKVADYSFRLIPVFSDVIAPDPEMAALIAKVREPHAAELSRVIGQAGSLLYRRGNFNGTWDDVLLAGMLRERDAQIALSPGFRWGASLPAGHDVTIEDLYGQTGMTYPNVYRQEMTGAMLRTILEDVCDNLFNTDPFYQQGGDMVRVGGMGFVCAPNAAMGSRISEMTLLSSGEKIEADKSYVVAGWASVNEGTEGPAIYDLMEDYIGDVQTIVAEPHENVKIVGVDGPGLSD